MLRFGFMCGLLFQCLRLEQKTATVGHCCDDAGHILRSSAICEKEATVFVAEENESKGTSAILEKETVGDARRSINDADQDSRDYCHVQADGNCQALLPRRRD